MKKLAFTDCVNIVGNAVKEYSGTKLYVSTGALDYDHIDFSQVEEVTYKSKPSRANLTAQAGDILFAKMQNTKKNIILDENTENYIYSTGFVAVHPKENLLSAKCLYHLINGEDFLRQKDENCSGATQKAITNKGLEKINITVPNIESQQHIVTVLDKINSIIFLYKNELFILDNLAKSRFCGVTFAKSKKHYDLEVAA